MRSCLYRRPDNAFRGLLIRKVTAANVGRLSRRKEPENWAFRDWLKECDIGAEEIDAIVHELYRQVSSEFDCKACADCCKGISPLLDDEDITRLSIGLGIPSDQRDFQIPCQERRVRRLVFQQDTVPSPEK